MAIRVLHLSHNGLPDPRIERLAKLSADYTESIFLGKPSKKQRLFPDVFESVKSTNQFNTASNLGIPFFYNRLLHDVQHEVDELNIDLIYAHNVIAGKIASDLAVPFVYDDHEYWSKQALIRRAKSKSLLVETKNRLRYFWAPRTYRKWEEVILRKAKAVVTVSKRISREHRERCSRCFTIPNFPLEQELKDLPVPSLHEGPLKGITLASDFQGLLQHSHPGNNIQVWEDEGGIYMDWVGQAPPKNWKWVRHRKWIPPAKLMYVLTEEYQIGAIPWREFWYHKYCMPNKAATYSHAGLILIINQDYDSIREFYPSWSYRVFSNESELRYIITNLSSASPQEILSSRIQIQDWAKEHVFMNRYSKLLERAIKGNS